VERARLIRFTLSSPAEWMSSSGNFDRVIVEVRDRYHGDVTRMSAAIIRKWLERTPTVNSVFLLVDGPSSKLLPGRSSGDPCGSRQLVGRMSHALCLSISLCCFVSANAAAGSTTETSCQPSVIL